MSEFFGYGTCSSQFDGRRHILTIFEEFITYKLYADRQTLNNIKFAMELPEQGAAEYIINYVLSHDEYDFLNLLRERYSVSYNDFTTIISAKCFSLRVFKTPAGYDREQNIRLLVQMVIARYYMRPQVENAFTEVNNSIIRIASGMRGIHVTQTFVNSLFNLTTDAMLSYGNSSRIKEMEDYVINHIKE